MPRPDSISSLGLEYYLNQPHSIVKHNGYAYDDFVKFVELPSPLKVNKTRLAEMFGVNRQTVTKWLEIYEKEKSDERD